MQCLSAYSWSLSVCNMYEYTSTLIHWALKEGSVRKVFTPVDQNTSNKNKKDHPPSTEPWPTLKLKWQISWVSISPTYFFGSKMITIFHHTKLFHLNISHLCPPPLKPLGFSIKTGKSSPKKLLQNLQGKFQGAELTLCPTKKFQTTFPSRPRVVHEPNRTTWWSDHPVSLEYGNQPTLPNVLPPVRDKGLILFHSQFY